MVYNIFIFENVVLCPHFLCLGCLRDTMVYNSYVNHVTNPAHNRFQHGVFSAGTENHARSDSNLEPQLR